MKHKRPPKPRGPSQKVAARIGRAAVLIAHGHGFIDVAEKIGVPQKTLADWQLRYPDYWALAKDQAGERTAEVLRNIAGTEEILKDPDRYLQMATAANKWAEGRGQELFVNDTGELTLTEFFHKHYLPTYQYDSAESTRQQLEVAAKRWYLVTGDPVLGKIDNALLAKFRDFLLASRGQKPGSKMSVVSVRRFLRYVCQILQKAGPPGFRNRDALGLIPVAPWVRPPKADQPCPRIVSPEMLSAVYRTAGMMTVPELPGIDAPEWWRALLAVAFNTGLRRGTLFALAWPHVDFDRKRVDIPPNILKSRRALVVPLNATAIEHLERIRGDQGAVFPWPYSREYFDKVFHRLQWEASLPLAEHFGLQGLRRTFATNLTAESLDAARIALGHTSSRVTAERYVQADALMTATLERLPQPAAFGNGNHNHRKNDGGDSR